VRAKDFIADLKIITRIEELGMIQEQRVFDLLLTKVKEYRLSSGFRVWPFYCFPITGIYRFVPSYVK